MSSETVFNHRAFHKLLQHGKEKNFTVGLVRGCRAPNDQMRATCGAFVFEEFCVEEIFSAELEPKEVLAAAFQSFVDMVNLTLPPHTSYALQVIHNELGDAPAFMNHAGHANSIGRQLSNLIFCATQSGREINYNDAYDVHVIINPPTLSRKRTHPSATPPSDMVLNTMQRLEDPLMLEPMEDKEDSEDETLYLRPKMDTRVEQRCINDLIENYPFELDKPFDFNEWKAVYNARLEEMKKEDEEEQME